MTHNINKFKLIINKIFLFVLVENILILGGDKEDFKKFCHVLAPNLHIYYDNGLVFAEESLRGVETALELCNKDIDFDNFSRARKFIEDVFFVDKPEKTAQFCLKFGLTIFYNTSQRPSFFRIFRK